VSTATKVPETFELTGDDARETLRRVGPGRLLADSWMRLRVSDGFSHARSLAYTISLVLVQALIGVIGLLTAVGSVDAGGTITRTMRAAVPGPAGEVLVTAVRQAHLAGGTGQYLGIVFGIVGSIVTGATLMGQTERALNRLYGVETDRPTFEKYRLATLLAVSAGALGAAAFTLLALGQDVGRSLDNRAADATWGVARWPLGLVFIAAAVALIFRWSPRRHQPGWSWLAFAAAVSVTLWCAVTVALGFFFSASGSFGRTYGPLAGVVALLLWAFLSATALLFGAAVAAQLEAARAGEPEPQDDEKVEHSEPAIEADPTRTREDVLA
jgi:YihY family inner membrane protein